MPKFIPYDHSQNAMVVINFNDQIQPGTFEYALHYLIEKKLDLSVFYPDYANDDGGRPAYDPAILLKIILFAYSRGITSSREIEWCCQTNILFKALSCDTVPHFTTIASFVSSHPQAIESVFEQVLLMCHQEGLLGNELFAIDGCKLPGNASKEWSGTFKELERKRDKLRKLIRHHLNRHQRVDAEQTGDAEREARTQQTIDTLSAAADRIDDFLKKSEPRMGKGRRVKEVKSNITDNDSAKMTTSKGTIQGYTGIAAVDKKHQVVVLAKALGEGQEHHSLQPVLQDIQVRFRRLKISQNIYQNGTIVTADTGFANEANMAYVREQGINAYIPDNQFRRRDLRFKEHKERYAVKPVITGKPGSVNKKSVIPASEFSFDQETMTCICPQGETLSHRSTRTNAQGVSIAFFEGRLLQCRNCPKKQACMHTPESADHRKGKGRQVSFVLKGKDGPRSNTPQTDWMKERIDSDEGRQIYGHRMSVVEPVFGNLGHNKGLRRFSLRGRQKVNGQWNLYCLVQNIEKLQRHGRLTA